MTLMDPIVALVKLRCGSSLDWRVMCAIIEQESGGDPWAIRYEHKFYERYICPLAANANLTRTEARLRAFSFGLCQVMGQTAREADYEGPLPMLFDPAINIDVGCRVFEGMLSRTGGDLRLAILRWNGGARPAFVDEVLARMDHYA